MTRLTDKYRAHRFETRRAKAIEREIKKVSQTMRNEILAITNRES